MFNDILGDKSSNGGKVLTRKTLAALPPFKGPKVIYCVGCLIGAERLAEEGNHAFKQWLLPESSLVVTQTMSINFAGMMYEPGWNYEGGFQFKKHYFGPNM